MRKERRNLAPLNTVHRNSRSDWLIDTQSPATAGLRGASNYQLSVFSLYLSAILFTFAALPWACHSCMRPSAHVDSRSHLHAGSPSFTSSSGMHVGARLRQRVLAFPFSPLPLLSSFLALKYRHVFHLMRFSITPEWCCRERGKKARSELQTKLNTALIKRCAITYTQSR